LNQEDLTELENAILKAERKLAGGDSPTKENLEFHRILGRATRNEMFRILMESILRILSEFLMKLNPTRQQSERVLKDHRILLKLIKEGNIPRCMEHMKKHLKDIEIRLSPLTTKRGREKP
jgi:DNA-binding FadR family transcriptional regulator